MKYINNCSSLKPDNIIKLKHYMPNGFSIYQTKPTVRPHFLPHHAYATYYSIV